MAHNNLANARSAAGDDSPAVEAEYRRGLELAPNHPYLLNGLANELSSSRRDDEAIHVARRAIVVNPRAHYITFNLANFLRSAKKAPEAERMYRRALRDSSGADARYYQGLGILYHESGRAAEAVEQYTRAVATADTRSVGLERDLATALREAER